METPWVSFSGKDCSGCKHLNERGYCEFTACIIPCMVRATIPDVKPQTNGDRIRAMSDEELARYFDSVQSLAYQNGVDVEPIRFYPNNYGAWLDWLRQEIKNGNRKT